METEADAVELELRREVLEAEGQGDLLLAYDRARQALEAHPGSTWLAHRTVLALARSGAPTQARRLFLELKLDARPEEDLRALAVRIDKDEAFAAPPERRAELLRKAADGYAAIYRDTGGVYPAINAATLLRLADDPEASTRLASEVLDRVGRAEGSASEDGWAAATRAEAAILVGDWHLAQTALSRAKTLLGGDRAALASMFRQLTRLCAHIGADPEVLSAIRPSSVIHYVGHRIGPRFPAEAEATVAQSIRDQVASLNVGIGCGALASGADILFAEALLARGADLHVVLPFRRDEFVALSVKSSGAEWTARFQRCLDAATSVTFSATDRHADDDIYFGHGARVAMGLAVLRAQMLGAHCEQVALWDGASTAALAGTGPDVSTWRNLGRSTTVIDPKGGVRRLAGESRLKPPPTSPIRGLLFGDVSGFSKLREPQIPRFVEGVLGTLARALVPFGVDLLSTNTWGDGIYLVLRDPVSAARAALALQRAMTTLNPERLGLPPHLGLRVGAHAGPVVECFDPITHRRSEFGTHVTRTARIEPVTPVGEVYATEDLAAYLALEASDLRCEYVGLMPAAKDYGMLRMYVVKEGGG